MPISVELIAAGTPLPQEIDLGRRSDFGDLLELRDVFGGVVEDLASGLARRGLFFLFALWAVERRVF